MHVCIRLKATGLGKPMFFIRLFSFHGIAFVETHGLAGPGNQRSLILMSCHPSTPNNQTRFTLLGTELRPLSPTIHMAINISINIRYIHTYRYVYMHIHVCICTYVRTSRTCICTYTLHYITLHSIPFHSIPFHSIPFHSIPFHSIPLQYSTVQYSTVQYSTLHYITLHYITLHTPGSSSKSLTWVVL